MAKTVQQIKADKSEVEQKMLGMLKDLETSSKMRINYVDVKTDRHSYEEEEKSRNGKKKLRQLKGVLDVMIQMDLGDDPDSIDAAVVGG